jgi:ABC-type phosphate/phosphonate transport system substrate-binding protein
MIASLAMYDPPWLRGANDRLWNAIAAHLGDSAIAAVPRALIRGANLDDVWRSPSLLLAQSCGYPLMTELRETVQLVATPCYQADGCVGALHRAAIVVRAQDPSQRVADLRGARAGINSMRSNTGMNLFRAAIAPVAEGMPFFSQVIITGSHARSLAAILSERIDVASIDAVTLAHLRERYPRHASGIRVLDWTAATPGLPLINAAATQPETIAALRQALVAATSTPFARDSLKRLHIIGFERVALEVYAIVPMIEMQARAMNYPLLR